MSDDSKVTSGAQAAQAESVGPFLSPREEADRILTGWNQGPADEPQSAFNDLEITEITIRPAASPDGHLRAYVRVVLNDAFAISGIRVVAGRAGLFVAFPRIVSKKDGRGHNVCYPVTRQAHAYFAEEVLREYRTLVGAA